MTYLLIITLALSPIPSQIPHTLFGVDAVLCHDLRTHVSTISVAIIDGKYWLATKMGYDIKYLRKQYTRTNTIAHK